jgi:hypothetical protein
LELYVKDIVRAVNKATGGSTLTKAARDSALTKLLKTARTELNMQIKGFEHLKTAQVRTYVEHCKAAGMSDRSLQNTLAHVRSALSSVGREHFARSEQMSNKAFGVSGASRDGTHRACSHAEYSAARSSASAGAAAAMGLQRELGLRAREAIQSPASLKGWVKQLEAGRSVSVIHGTKGGRARETAPVDRERAIAAVKAAIDVCKEQGGKLIDSSSLEGAARMYQRECQDAGLSGELASHSLRCAYAQERYEQHLESLGDRAEALAATSLDLGHGDGRGTYVAQVYLRNGGVD